MEKSGKGKVIAIIILLIISLGLVGYLGYHITVSDKEKINEIKDLKNEIKDLKNSNVNVEDEDKNVIGYYSYQEPQSEVGKDVYLGLFKNNTAVFVGMYESPIRYFGGYEIKDNEIVFNYKWIDASQRQDKYEGLMNFKIDDDNLILEKDGEKITLKKITKDEYYNAIKKATIPISTTVTD